MVMVIPKYPRHLSQAERSIEQRRTVAAMIQEITADNPGKTLDGDKMTVAFLAIVNSNWQAERIADLELRVETMAQQMAALEAQSAPAKRALHKLKGGHR